MLQPLIEALCDRSVYQVMPYSRSPVDMHARRS